MGRNRKIFKCKKTPRYLIGQVPKIKALDDLKIYNEHRLRVCLARPEVDSKPPKMNPYNYLKIPKLMQDSRRFIEIDIENKKLLQKINVINKTKGNIDSYNPNAYRDMTRWKSHHKHMLAICADNLYLYHLIKTATSQYSRKMHKIFWDSQYDRIKLTCKFPIVALFKDNMDKIVAKMPSLSNCGRIIERPKCFMEFKLKDGPLLGIIIIDLYEDFVPVTVQNFLSLCRGDSGISYLHSHIHKIVPGKYVELGDITRGCGKGGKSIFGGNFAEESYFLKHSKPGVLSMVRVGRKENNSMFSITFNENEDLNGKRVVFGKVIRGMEIIFNLQGMGRKFGKPMPIIYVSDCGEWFGKKHSKSKK